jgi:shikimate 5-dehydrogenase
MQSEETGDTDRRQPEEARTVLEQQQEERNLRRLQIMMNMVMSVIAQDTTLTYEAAAEMIVDSRRAALAMFPDKELAYELIYQPKLQRLMRDRFRLQ